MARVLSIEDDQETALFIAAALRKAGHEVIHASDGVQAVAVARRENPDLILLDLALPGGGGESVIRRLRDLGGSSVTPVLIVTGSKMVSEEQLEEMAAQGLVYKPIDAGVLLTVVEDLLGGARPDVPREGGELG